MRFSALITILAALTATAALSAPNIADEIIHYLFLLENHSSILASFTRPLNEVNAILFPTSGP